MAASRIVVVVDPHTLTEQIFDLISNLGAWNPLHRPQTTKDRLFNLIQKSDLSGTPSGVLTKKSDEAPTEIWVRIADALTRIADRFDADAKEFSAMVDSGKGLSVSRSETPPLGHWWKAGYRNRVYEECQGHIRPEELEALAEDAYKRQINRIP